MNIFRFIANIADNNDFVENQRLKNKVKDLTDLCYRKDACFDELMSDALRHGSSLAGKQMAWKKEYLKNKF